MKKGTIVFFLIAIAAIIAVAVLGIRKDAADNAGDDRKPAMTEAVSGRAVGIVAHRGYWNCEEGGYARNSFAAFKAAADAGFWGTEFDVNMTADGVLLVFHDGIMRGKRIEKTEYSELADYELENGETVPTLDKFLEYASEQETFPMLVFELKKHSSEDIRNRAVTASVAMLEKYGMLDPSKVMFISFDLRQCELFAAAAPGFTVQYLDNDKAVRELVECGVNGVDLQFRYLLNNPSYIREARKHGFSVNTWTVNQEDDMKQVLAAGIDQITTDYPAVARTIIQDSGLAELFR